MTTAPVEATTSEVSKRRRRREIAACGLGALLAAFAVLNLDDVKVHWIVTSGHAPLTIVIVVSVLFGVALDRLVILRKSRRAKDSQPVQQ